MKASLALPPARPLARSVTLSVRATRQRGASERARLNLADGKRMKGKEGTKEGRKEASRGKSWETTAKKDCPLMAGLIHCVPKKACGATDRYLGSVRKERESGGYLSTDELNNGSIRYCIRWNKLWRGASSPQSGWLAHIAPREEKSCPSAFPS